MLILLVVALLASLAPTPSALHQHLSIQVANIPREEALRLVVAELDLHCVFAGEVQGTVTLLDQDLTARQVLDRLPDSRKRLSGGWSKDDLVTDQKA